MKNGLFITFEGTEGSGKTTQAALLANALRAKSFSVVEVREPGGTLIGEEIRHLVKHSENNMAMQFETELLLMSASRSQLVREIIRPALAEGSIVIGDRFYDSTIVYQGYGRRLPLSYIKRITEFAVGPTKPDLTLVCSIPQKVSEARLRSRKLERPVFRDRIEEADKNFFRRVIFGYNAISLKERRRIKLIDGTATIEEVRKSVWQLVLPLLKIRSLFINANRK